MAWCLCVLACTSQGTRSELSVQDVARPRGCREGTHSDEHKLAIRVDRDANRGDDLGADRGGLPRGDIDTPDPVVTKVLPR